MGDEKKSWREHHELMGGKYTRWAPGLTDEQLAALLWCVGEYGIRAHPEEHDVTKARCPADARKIGALDMIVGFVKRRPLVMDDVRKRIQDLLTNDPRGGVPLREEPVCRSCGASCRACEERRYENELERLRAQVRDLGGTPVVPR